jgi:hypothetical protein
MVLRRTKRRRNARSNIMQRIANTQSDMPAVQPLTDEELAQVCGGFNPQPDPPAWGGMPWNTLNPISAPDRFAIGR